ncbi:MAG: 30S ribosomal protein S16 [Acidobacteriota bacterium]
MLKIRLRRMGRKHSPFYRVLVSDSRRTPGARFNEVLGTYDPRREPAVIQIDVERADHWMKKGAHPSETVARLIEKARVAAAVAPTPAG